MAFFIPHDVFQRILNFKDPRYEFVRGGGQTPSAQCMPFNSETNFQDLRDPWDTNTLMIWNRRALVHHGTGQRPFDPPHTTGGIVNALISFRWLQLLLLCLILGCKTDKTRSGRDAGGKRPVDSGIIIICAWEQPLGRNTSNPVANPSRGKFQKQKAVSAYMCVHDVCL